MRWNPPQLKARGQPRPPAASGLALGHDIGGQGGPEGRCDQPPLPRQTIRLRDLGGDPDNVTA